MDGRYDVIVVGAGIAGLTAAMYCARQQLKTLVISVDIGGQLLMATEIQNYPGFQSISGFDLARRVEEQARSYGVEVVYDEVKRVAEAGEAYSVETLSGSKYETLALILACGKAPRELGVPGEKNLRGRGVSYCAVCDAPLYRGRSVALVGWGHHGVESANLLGGYAKTLYWLFPGERPVEDEDVLGPVAARDNVVLMPHSQVVEIVGENRVRGLVVRDKRTGEERRLDVDGVFIEVGYEARVEFARGLVDVNERGEVVVDKLCRTSRRGIFACGDVTDMPYKQAVIAAGMGAVAALSASNYVLQAKGRRAALTSDWRHVRGAGARPQLKI